MIDPYVRPGIAILPYSWRFLQCLRRYRDTKDFWNLVNAGKYASSMMVTLFSTLRGFFPTPIFLVLWIASCIVSTGYSFLWDLKKDWDLGHWQSRNKFLRDRLMYPRWFYYWAILSDLVLRCSWTLTISASNVWPVSADVFSSLIASLEVLRRGQWNLIRLENEQLQLKSKRTATHALKLPFAIDEYELRPKSPITQL